MHKTHPEIIQRLKRAAGHLKSVVAMIEEGKSCVELAQQLHAVEQAVAKAKKALIHDHIEHCLEDSKADTRTALRELKQLAKYL
jgi:uncharacterized protein